MWDGRADHVRKPWSGFTQDVFSAEVWLASAPLHEAGKTTRSGNTLKTGIGRGQLSFASDNPSSNPNACPLISIFSKPRSEVATATRTHALNTSSIYCFGVFVRFTQSRVLRQIQNLFILPDCFTTPFMLLFFH